MSSTTQTVTVLGGTGFLGRRAVLRLRQHGLSVRVASRHPARSRDLFGGGDPNLLSVAADIHNEQSIASAIAGAHAVVNAVSLYLEHGSETFEAVHVEAAGRVARLAAQAGIPRLIHVSGIGSDANSASPYIRSRGRGEQAVRAAFPEATIVRPAVMFGPDDAFLNVIVGLLRQLPVYPMFGRGKTRLQPAHVDDVAEAVARAIERDDLKGVALECAGPRIYSYEELLMTAARSAGVQPRLLPMPFGAWHALAWIAEMLPHPPVSRNQVELMEIDSVATPDAPGLRELGIAPQSIESALEEKAHAATQKAA